MEALDGKTGRSKLESWPVRDRHQVPDAGRVSTPKDTLGGANQRISRMEMLFPIAAGDWDPILADWDPVYSGIDHELSGGRCDKDEDEDEVSSSLPFYQHSSSSIRGTLITSTPIYHRPLSASTTLVNNTPEMADDEDEDQVILSLSKENSSISNTKTSTTSTSILDNPFWTSTLP